MRVIDLATVKEFLRIDNTDQDATIEAKIPVIDAKVKQICNNNFNLQCYGRFVAGSKKVEVLNVGREPSCNFSPAIMDTVIRDLPLGTLVEGEAITPTGKIEEVYYTGYYDSIYEVPSFELDAVATKSGDFYFYAGINRAYQDIIAKGVQYLINTTSATLPGTGLASESIGSYSYSLAGGSEKIDGKSGMPHWFVKGLPRYHG